MRRAVAIALLILVAFLPIAFGKDQKLTVAELLAKHRESVGPEDVLKNLKNRFAEGTVVFTIHTGGAGKLNGKMYLISETSKMRFALDYSDPHYGENFLFDGERAEVFNSPRTSFGQFVYDQSQILRDGLLGSVLNASWALFNPDAHNAKLSYNGLKNVDGQSLHELVYRAKKGGGGEVRLYFDPETFRHVSSVYTVEIAPHIGVGSDSSSARQQTVRYRMDERFSNFQQVNGLTLPGSWNIHFSVDGYSSRLLEWQIRLRNADDNTRINPKNFSVD